MRNTETAKANVPSGLVSPLIRVNLMLLRSDE